MIFMNESRPGFGKKKLYNFFSVSQYLFITLEFLGVLLIPKLHTVALPCLYFVFLLYWLRWLRLPSWCAM
jgi:hypothetical protein